MPADLNKARDLFLHAVGKLPPEEWDGYVAGACGGDVELERHVGELLRAHREPGSFLNQPASAVGELGAFVAGSTAGAAGLSVPEVSGTRVGPYKLLQPIGEGGMGTVYMAEQTHPVKRLVALKLIKAGMDSRQVLARFGAERQALALMDHPNIAKVLDAGATDSGRPYFVMELVKGVPITRFCDENRLSTRERIELAIPVCQAVQHAHQKGVIHRDLKPSNILVALYDGKPVPKVIDFGVAKAAGPRLTDQTLYTEFGAIVGTLEYMSPEQAQLNQLDIDTRSDIYSLGVLLYELLTGTTPLDRKRLKAAAILELLRFVREEESPPPSLRLSTTEELPSIAACRNIEPRKLSGLVRGELDWIVMKALEKDRNRRYETANGLAADLKRHLDDEPVQACPPSAWYRSGKFARRHKRALTAAALATLSLVVAVAVLAESNVRIKNERGLKERALRLAEVNEGKANAQYRRAQKNLSKARQAVDKMLTRVGEQGLAHEPQMDGVRKQLLEDALAFYLEFLGQEGDDAEVRRETALAYGRAGGINSRLGHDREAEGLLGEAFARLEALAAEFPHESVDRATLISLYQSFVYLKTVTQGESLAKLRRTVELAEGLVREFPGVPAYRRQLAQIHISLGAVLRDTGQPREAEASLRHGLGLAEEAGDRSILANGSTKLGFLLAMRGDPEAERWYRRAIALLGAEIAAGRNDDWPRSMMGGTHSVLGRFLASQGRNGEAVDAFRRAVNDLGTLHTVHPTAPAYNEFLNAALFGLAGSLAADERTDEAVDVYMKGLELMSVPARGFNAPAEAPTAVSWLPPEMTRSLGPLFRSLKAAGKDADAERIGRRSLAALDALAAGYSGRPGYLAKLAESYLHLGSILAAEGDGPGARAAWLQALELAPDNATANNSVAWLLATCPDAKLRNPQRSVALAERAVELAPKAPGHWNTLGVARYRAGDWKAAIEALTRSMELGKGGDGNDWFFLAMAHRQLGDRRQARSWYDKAVLWMEKNQPTNAELLRFRDEAAALLEVNEAKD